ncbi:MAG: hypothetical protein E7406_08780 [Ruminococcaceae bacterium]|nr:hypothetical protein [Oscillospiraceae bacterium]
MKKVVSILMIVMMLTGLMSACSKNTRKISVYFKDAQSNNLKEEKHEIELDKDVNKVELAKIAVSELIKGPKDKNHVGVISKDARLLSLVINSGVVTVNMSSHFSEKKGAEELLLIFALVNTLCSIEGVEGVVIQVEGKPIIKGSTGEEWGVLGMGDMALNTEDNTTVKIYFPDKNGENLVIENRKIDTQQALSLEKAIVSELIKGPESNKLSSAVADGTKLLGIETKDGVCYVNFSSEFKSKSSSGSAATRLSLYSVVNSLCELRNVDSVQILVNGETGVEFGNFVLDIPYEANYDLVK